MPGALWAIPDPQGWYPALLPGEGIVQGMLHEAGDVVTLAVHLRRLATDKALLQRLRVAGSMVCCMKPTPSCRACTPA